MGLRDLTESHGKLPDFPMIYVVEAWFYLDELLAVSQKESKTFNTYPSSYSRGLALTKTHLKKEVSLEM